MEEIYGHDSITQRAEKLNEEAGELLEAIIQHGIVQSGKSMLEMTEAEALRNINLEFADVTATYLSMLVRVAMLNGKGPGPMMTMACTTAWDKITQRQVDPEYLRHL